MYIALPYIDLNLNIDLDVWEVSDESNAWSLAHRLSKLRWVIGYWVRNLFFEKVLEYTCSRENTDKPRLVIDRLAAATARETSQSSEQSVFLQAYRQVADVHPQHFLSSRPGGSNAHTAFEVQFKGENAEGQGGPYRQFFTDICHELQPTDEGTVPTLDLFLPCPNKQVGVGENRDKYVLNPLATSPFHHTLYELLGRIIGTALRTNILMSLNLPSFVWRPLVGERPQRADLLGVDFAFVNSLLSKIDQLSDADEAEFTKHFGDLCFSTTLSSQTCVDLKPDGRNIEVQFKDRAEFAALAEKARLTECRQQVLSIKRGICELIPAQLLTLCTWKDLERRVCGRPFIDTKLLRRHTEYSGVKEDADHIQWFWQVLEEFDQAERRRFIKFAWAQERIPGSDDEFQNGGQTIRMLIKDAFVPPGQKADDRLPRADTCFFNLELPAYSSPAVMRRQLSTVINLSGGMDGDDPRRGSACTKTLHVLRILTYMRPHGPL